MNQNNGDKNNGSFPLPKNDSQLCLQSVDVKYSWL